MALASKIYRYRHFEYYFNVDVYNSSPCHSDEQRHALIDGYVYGLHQAEVLDGTMSPSTTDTTVARVIRHVCTEPAFCKDAEAFCATALAYMNSTSNNLPVRESTTAFLVGYQVAFLRANKYSPALFMQGQELLEHVYGALILSDQEGHAIAEAGRTAYQRNLAILREDLPPGERA